MKKKCNLLHSFGISRIESNTHATEYSKEYPSSNATSYLQQHSHRTVVIDIDMKVESKE